MSLSSIELNIFKITFRDPGEEESSSTGVTADPAPGKLSPPPAGPTPVPGSVCVDGAVGGLVGGWTGSEARCLW